MKRLILFLACGALGQVFLTQDVVAFPGERMPYRAAHFAQKVVYKIDNHVIHPVRHGIARRVR